MEDDLADVDDIAALITNFLNWKPVSNGKFRSGVRSDESLSDIASFLLQSPSQREYIHWFASGSVLLNKQ